MTGKTKSMAKSQCSKSTNVRIAKDLLSHTLRGVGRVSPRFAGQLALRLFTTVRRSKARAGERDVLEHAERFEVPFGTERIVAWAWGSGPTVLLAHGWNGRGTQLGSFVAPLLEAGHRVVMFDNVGHGASSGRRSSIVDFARVIRKMTRCVDARAVIAHSMGGAGTTIALGEGLELERVVLIAAPVTPDRWVRGFSRMFGLEEAVERSFRAALTAYAGRSPSALDGRDIAQSLTTPLLAIHDVDDREVPFAASETLTSVWPGARLLRTQGLGHQRILSDADVVAAAVQFLQAGQLQRAA